MVFINLVKISFLRHNYKSLKKKNRSHHCTGSSGGVLPLSIFSTELLNAAICLSDRLPYLRKFILMLRRNALLTYSSSGISNIFFIFLSFTGVLSSFFWQS